MHYIFYIIELVGYNILPFFHLPLKISTKILHKAFVLAAYYSIEYCLEEKGNTSILKMSKEFRQFMKEYKWLKVNEKKGST